MTSPGGITEAPWCRATSATPTCAGATFDHNSGQLARHTNAQLHDHFAASSDSYQPSLRPWPQRTDARGAPTPRDLCALRGVRRLARKLRFGNIDVLEAGLRGFLCRTSEPQASPQAADAGSPASAKTGYRPEVQGLRALAVLMVVTYHVWLGRVSGGVDIFLLISAFLMTLASSRKVESGSPLRLRAATGCTCFKRLLPAAVVVILGVLAGTWAILPQSRWPDVLDQAWASLLYRQNWLLADTAVDYYAQDHSGASPLQHFWSLSIQGQVFILWPLVFAGCRPAVPAAPSRTGRTRPLQLPAACWPRPSAPSSPRPWSSRSTRPPPTRPTPTSTRGPGSGSSRSARCWPWPCPT